MGGAGWLLRFSTESEKKSGGRLEGMVLTGGPHPSATSKRERGKGGGGGWARPEKGAWGRVFGPKGRIERKGEKEIPFPFLFIPNFPIEILSRKRK